MRNSISRMPYLTPRLETVVFQVERCVLDVSVKDVDVSFDEGGVNDGGDA